MTENNANKTKEVEIDQKKLIRMAIKIYNLERDNTKTNLYSETKIKEHIQRIIEEEVQKCY